MQTGINQHQQASNSDQLGNIPPMSSAGPNRFSLKSNLYYQLKMTKK
jgi:hypothetical protein